MEGRGVVCDWIIKYILYQHRPEMNMKGKNCGPGVQLHCGEPVGNVAEGQPDLQEDWVHHAGAQRKPEPHTLLMNKHHIIIWAWTEQLNFQLKIDGKTYLASSNQKKAAKQVFKYFRLRILVITMRWLDCRPLQQKHGMPSEQPCSELSFSPAEEDKFSCLANLLCCHN